MRVVFYQILLALALKGFTIVAAAEQFKYYVWIDEEGIVHAEQEAPKGRDYQVRIIEDVNANVVPAEDFRPYGDLPAPIDEEAPDDGEDTASAGAPDDATGTEPNDPATGSDSPAARQTGQQ